MIICAIVVIVFFFVITHKLPFIYATQKRKMMASCAELANENEDTSRFSLMSLVIYSLPILIYYLSSDVMIMVFCFVLATAAYTDLCKRWLPDLIIYILLAISVYSLKEKDLTIALFALFFYLMPIMMLSCYGYIKKKESWIASGDYYVLPSIGLMLIPEYAAGVMLATLAIMLFLMRYIKQIPLITVAYFTFTGFNLCLFSGFF